VALAAVLASALADPPVEKSTGGPCGTGGLSASENIVARHLMPPEGPPCLIGVQRFCTIDRKEAHMHALAEITLAFMLAGLAVTAAIGTFYLQFLRSREEQLLELGFERAEKIARRLLEIQRVPLLRQLERAKAKEGADRTLDPDGRPLADRVIEYVNANLPESQDNAKVTCFVLRQLGDEEGEKARRLAEGRTRFLELLGELTTAKPTLASLRNVCPKIIEATKRYTNQDTAIAPEYIAGQVEKLVENRRTARRWLQGAIILFAIGGTILIAHCFWTLGLHGSIDGMRPHRIHRHAHLQHHVEGTALLWLALATVISGYICAGGLARVCFWREGVQTDRSERDGESEH